METLTFYEIQDGRPVRHLGVVKRSRGTTPKGPCMVAISYKKISSWSA